MDLKFEHFEKYNPIISNLKTKNEILDVIKDYSFNHSNYFNQCEKKFYKTKAEIDVKWRLINSKKYTFDKREYLNSLFEEYNLRNENSQALIDQQELAMVEFGNSLYKTAELQSDPDYICTQEELIELLRFRVYSENMVHLNYHNFSIV